MSTRPCHGQLNSHPASTGIRAGAASNVSFIDEPDAGNTAQRRATARTDTEPNGTFSEVARPARQVGGARSQTRRSATGSYRPAARRQTAGRQPWSAGCSLAWRCLTLPNRTGPRRPSGLQGEHEVGARSPGGKPRIRTPHAILPSDHSHGTRTPSGAGTSTGRRTGSWKAPRFRR